MHTQSSSARSIMNRFSVSKLNYRDIPKTKMMYSKKASLIKCTVLYKLN